jgi:hypothetical protein
VRIDRLNDRSEAPKASPTINALFRDGYYLRPPGRPQAGLVRTGCGSDEPKNGQERGATRFEAESCCCFCWQGTRRHPTQLGGKRDGNKKCVYSEVVSDVGSAVTAGAKTTDRTRQSSTPSPPLVAMRRAHDRELIRIARCLLSPGLGGTGDGLGRRAGCDGDDTLERRRRGGRDDTVRETTRCGTALHPPVSSPPQLAAACRENRESDPRQPSSSAAS